MKRRLMAILLSLTMALSLLPTSAFAHDGNVYNDADEAYAATGVTAEKTATVNDNGTITITLSVTGKTSTSTTTNNQPADVVLVIDSSGSMAYCGLKGHRHSIWDDCYTECTKENNSKHWQEVTHTGWGGTWTEWEHISGTDCEERWGRWYYLSCNIAEHDCRRGECVSRMSLAKEAATEFVDGLLEGESQIKVALLDFSGTWYGDYESISGSSRKPGGKPEKTDHVYVPLTQNEATLDAAIDQITDQHSDGTSYTAGLTGAAEALNNGTNDNQFVVFISDGEPNNGNDGTRQAEELMDDDVTIITVGIDADNYLDKLQAISSEDEDGKKLCYTGSATALSGILEKVREEITRTTHAGTDAKMTDVINTESFELVGELPSGLELDNGEIIWDIGEIGEDKQEVSFTIKLKDGEDPNTAVGKLFTNDDVSLTFTSTQKDNEEVKFTKEAIGEPTVDVYSVTYTDGADGAVFADQTTYNLLSGADTPEFDSAAFAGTDPEREGYTFKGWDSEIAETVSGDEYEIVYTAQWEANDVAYTVKHYTEKLDGTYELKETEEKKGTTGTTATATAKTYEGFTFDANNTNNVKSGTIAGDGSLVLKLYYTRDSYKVTYSYTGTVPTGAPAVPDEATYKYGETVTVDTEFKAYEATATVGEDNYVFTGWDKSGTFTMPANDVTIKGTWELDNFNDPGDKPTGGDKIPDKYQALVTYKVENGTWDGTDSADKTAVFTLYEKSAENVWTKINPAPVLGETIPDVSAAVPAEGYTVPSYWTPTPHANDAAKHGAVYVYTFLAQGDALTFTFDANGGAWSKAVDGYTMNTGNTTASKEYYQGNTVEEIGTEPTYEGYEFIGWYAKNEGGELTAKYWAFDNSIEYIYEDTTVYAKWQKTETEEPAEEELTGKLTVILQDENGTYLGGTSEPIEVTNSYLVAAAAGEGVDYVYPASVTSADGKNYIYDEVVSYSAPLSGSVTKNGQNILVFLQYTLDVVGGDDGGSDKIPDKYQRPVTFKVVNGTWDGENADDIVVWVTLVDENGNWSVDGTADFPTKKIPTGMIANTGYTKNPSGGWDNDPNEVTDKITASDNKDSQTYTYSFIKIGEAEFDWNDVDGKGTALVSKSLTGKLPTNYSEAFTVNVLTEDGKMAVVGMTEPMTAAGTAPFVFEQKLIFSAPEVYTFFIQEIAGSTSYLTYDTTVYVLTVDVDWAEELTQTENGLVRQLEVKSWLISNGDDEQLNATLTITNKSSYTGVTPNPGPAPTLNTADHYAYVVGYPDGTVQPQGNITRAEVATIFFRLLTDESRNQYWMTTNDYSDVAAGDWYNNAISTLSNAGILSGYPDGTFRPDAPITRAEMAKIVAIFAELEKSEDMFSDIAGHWAEAYIKLAAGNGWINGYPDGSFKPQQAITRAETMTMINRVLNRVPANESRLLAYDEMLTFPDCQPGEWYYIAVQEATNSHNYHRVDGSNAADEQWVALRENRDWTQLEF